MINLIVDIDGTIADHTHRTALLESKCGMCGCIMHAHDHCSSCHSDLLTYTKDSFEKFLDPSLMSLDVPVPNAQRVILTALRDPKSYTVHYITGRKEVEHRNVTLAWLQSHFGFTSQVSTLSMRSPNESNMRPSDYKEVKFTKLKKDKGLAGTFIFFEDDPYVHGMYAKHGLVIIGPGGWDTLMPKGLNRLMEKQLSK